MQKLLAVIFILIGLVLALRWLIRRFKASGILPVLLILLLVTPGLVAFAPMTPPSPVVGAALIGLDGLQIEIEPDPALWATITQFLTMGGFAALVAIGINICKAFGWIKDGTSGTISAIVNLVGLVGVFVLQNYVPNVSITLIDEHMTIIAQILTSIFTYVYQYWISAKTHGVLSAGNVPIIGTSLTPKAIELSVPMEGVVISKVNSEETE